MSFKTKLSRKDLEARFEFLIQLMQEMTENMPENDPLRKWALLQVFLSACGRTPETVKYTPPKKKGGAK